MPCRFLSKPFSGFLSAVFLLLFFNACSPIAESEPNRTDLPGALESLRETHDLSDARLLFAGEFRQGWRKGNEPDFEPALAELIVTADTFHVLAVLGDRDIHNSATGFNELTWKSGDVFEVFLQTDADTYYEFHITPENRHLFLAWTTDGFASVRAKESTVQDFMMADREVLFSETRVQPDANRWSVYARIPFEKVGLIPGKTYPDLKVAFCRYDTFRDGRSPILSATPDFPKVSYHLREFWHPVDLLQ